MSLYAHGFFVPKVKERIMVSAISVANELIRLGKQDNNYFTPMQLLKLVYIAHGWMFGFFNKPLITDSIEAWKYGPVIPELYHKVKVYGGNQIPQEINSLFSFNHEQLNEEEKSVVNFVYRKYGNLGGVKLSMITHQNDTPWSRIFSLDGRGDIIPNDLIRQHYVELSSKVLAENG